MIPSVFLWQDSSVKNLTVLFLSYSNYRLLLTYCSHALHVASLLLSVQILKLNLYPFVLLLPLNPVPCREEITQ